MGIDFWGDLDMSLPPGSAYGDIGNESRPSFKNFELLNFFVSSDYMESKDMFLGDNT